jgi:hypothetical protein
MKKIYTSLLVSIVCIGISHAQTISLTGFNAVTEDFNTLSNTTGSTTNNLTINGWYMTESGGGARDNDQYAVETGASPTGDTYSYGAAASTERALGSLRSGTLIPVFGAKFTNNTGIPITAFTISYTGEEWRLGTAARVIPDSLAFEYSTDATSLTTGTWTKITALNFVTPNNATVGAKDGNAVANRTAISASIVSLSIGTGNNFWIRWVDIDASGADDGLAIDDFSLTPIVDILPINLLSFSALKENNGSKISWSTAQIINGSSFVVERSSNGVNWEKIATVPYAGNSNTSLNFSVVDDNPLTGNNFYRLRMVDADNKVTYSSTRQVNFNNAYSYTIYPNPAQDFLILTTDKKTDRSTVLQLMNAKGQPVIRKQLMDGAQTYRINIKTLTPGVYYARITSSAGKITTLQFVKQ